MCLHRQCCVNEPGVQPIWQVYDGGYVSAIIAITSNGILNCKLTQDTVNSDEFKDFIEVCYQMNAHKNLMEGITTAL